MTDAALVASLRARVRTEVGRAVRAGPVALLDFPDYGNPGDSAIWLGALECLSSLGFAPPVYASAQRNFDERLLRRALPSGTILLTGGGNLGDLWPRHQAFRERVIAAFPDRAIVQFPQSIHFDSADALAQARSAFTAHPDFTLLVRDSRSLEVATSRLGCRTQLCPDLSLCVDQSAEPALQRQSSAPRRRVLKLLRTDHEAASAHRSDSEAVDWVDDSTSLLSRLMRPGYTSLARQRVRRGARLIQSARVLVTDRLHGHLLALLLGVPHVVLGDRNGKVRSFIDTWTSRAANLRWADTQADVDRLASELLSCS